MPAGRDKHLTTPCLPGSAENRYKFSRMCDTIGVDQPQWKELTSVEDAKAFAATVSCLSLVWPRANVGTPPHALAPTRLFPRARTWAHRNTLSPTPSGLRWATRA